MAFVSVLSSVLFGAALWAAPLALATPSPSTPPGPSRPPSPSPSPTPSPSANSDAAADARTVYCLRDDNSSNLVQAAEDLGLGKAKSGGRIVPSGQAGPVSVTEWRDGKRRADFERACASLVMLRKLPKSPDRGTGFSGLGTMVNTWSSAFLGALATLLATTYTTRKSDLKERAKELREATGSYNSAVTAVLNAQGTPKGAHEESREMAQPVRKLSETLLREQGRSRSRDLLQGIEEKVGELDAKIRAEDIPDAEARRELKAITSELFRAAGALERPPLPGLPRRKGRT
ncbi:hypothetical protein AB0J52_36385 [Spirillospora sp. NPDC049652]